MHIKVVCAIVYQSDRYFVCQRPAHKADGLRWEFPGGKLEEGESAEEALLREIDEELGWRIEIERPLTTVLAGDSSRKIELLPFLCRPVAQSVPQLHEHLASAWLSLDELRRIDLCDADRPILDELASKTNEAKI